MQTTFLWTEWFWCFGFENDIGIGQGQRTGELLVKEALHIQVTPAEEGFNWDRGLKFLGCWTAVMRRQEGRGNPRQPLTSDDVYP